MFQEIIYTYIIQFLQESPFFFRSSARQEYQ